MPTAITPTPMLLLRRVVPIIFALVVTACGGPGEEGSGAQPPTVSVLSAYPQKVSLSAEFPGRLEPWRIAEVRAQVSGIVLERTFTEGSTVEEGEVLYQLDPAPYRARVAEEKSNLAVARANLLQARAQHERIRALGELKAVSELDAITAEATFRQAEAQVEAATAALDNARIDLDRATVKAPISGRIGRSLVTEGALVGEGEATHLATIQQLDPIYASFNQGSADALQLRNSFAQQQLTLTADNSLPVRLILEDGNLYPEAGRLLFGEVTVEPTTSQINFRAAVPNEEHLLLPGMFIRVQLEQVLYQDAYLVPQKVAIRDGGGDRVRVVNEDNVVELKPVVIAGEQDNHWIVTKGLAPGDQVLMDNFFKAKPGHKVIPHSLENSIQAAGGE